MQSNFDQTGAQPLVSICCITYNHAKYIRDAMESFLMQKTNFPIEIIINDDASTDGTIEILKEYQRNYPEIVIPIFHEENQYSKGIRGICARNTFPIARGKYLALCEGDDYWTDPLKLQKQVDFLEQNPDCSCCYHPVRWVYEGDRKPSRIEGPSYPGNTKFSSKDIIGGYYIRTVSLVFRSEVFNVIPDWIFLCPNGDIPIQLICASKGNAGYIGGEPMAIYRRGREGAWSQDEFGEAKAKVRWIQKLLEDNFKIMELFNEYTGYKYNNIIVRRNRKNVITTLLLIKNLTGRPGIVRLMAKHYGELLRVTDKRVINFWLQFVLGRNLGGTLYLKSYSRLKKIGGVLRKN